MLTGSQSSGHSPEMLEFLQEHLDNVLRYSI